MRYQPSMLTNKHDNFYHSTSQFFMVALSTKSVLRQNCSQPLLSLPKAADLSQNPLENHSALQLSLLPLSSILLPFTREENESFAVWGQLNEIIQLTEVVFFSLGFTLSSSATGRDVTSEAS